jgi:hypothetical protein
VHLENIPSEVCVRLDADYPKWDGSRKTYTRFTMTAQLRKGNFGAGYSLTELGVGCGTSFQEATMNLVNNMKMANHVSHAYRLWMELRHRTISKRYWSGRTIVWAGIAQKSLKYSEEGLRERAKERRQHGRSRATG